MGAAVSRLAIITLSLCLGLTLAPSAYGAHKVKAGASSGPALDPASPQAIYHQAWELVNKQYYDGTFNHQDWTRWEHRYDGKLATADDAYRACDTMLASLCDRWTRLLPPESFSQQKDAIAARISGIGAQLGQTKTGELVVIAAIEGTPAEKAGLMPLDQVVEINGESAKGWSPEQAAKVIRGEIGTEVKLKILRGNDIKEFTIVRAEIPIRSIQVVKMLDSEVGYVRLSTFLSEHAAEELVDALSKLSPARGIILDLRDNAGGLVSNAINVVSLFVKQGVVVTVKGRDDLPQYQRTAPDTMMSDQPLVVLINHGTASASEITSGALRDYNRADLVGQTSFGKGVMQAVNKLNDGSGVNITIARYLTPEGIDINKKGISPSKQNTVDLTLEDLKAGRGPWWYSINGAPALKDPDAQKDIQLKRAVEIMKDKIARLCEPQDVLKLPKVELNSVPNETIFLQR